MERFEVGQILKCQQFFSKIKKKIWSFLKFLKKVVKISKFAKLQTALSQPILNIFWHLKKLVKAEVFYFLKKNDMLSVYLAGQNFFKFDWLS